MSERERVRRKESRGREPRVEGPHTYRCPVCGHTDSVSLGGREKVRIRCTHCNARLEARLRAEDRERVSVQVSTDGGA